MSFSRTRSLVLLLASFRIASALPAELFGRDLHTRDAAACCSALTEALPGKVEMPGNSEFISQQNEYFIVQQQQLTPACRVVPTSPEDVSTIVKLALDQSCQFAVRGGGHGHTVGESNMNSTGFTIDLSSLNEFSLSEDGETASTGSGALWVNFYKFVVDKQKVVVGGRMPTVGVAGYLLGGGVSFFSNSHGFASTQVKNYEIVLSDGSIVNANQEERSDLYWALKMGNTNYGIVTRFDLQTLPITQMWGGGIMYDSVDNLRGLVDWLIGFAKRSYDNDKGHSGIGVGSSASGYGIWHLNSYSEPVEYPSPLFDGVKFNGSIENSMKIQDLVSVSADVYTRNTIDMRTKYLTFTYKPDTDFSMEVFAKAEEMLNPFLNRTGMSWSLAYQPISRAMIKSSQANGGNPTGLTEDDGDLFLALYTLFWGDAADDKEILGAGDALLEWTKATATERGLLHPFLYLDYADGSQPVYASWSQDNINKMKSIQEKYDPGLAWRKVWPAGFRF